jgi:pSer/pThr/pTyr-binding forkhead associated (FHA) protein
MKSREAVDVPIPNGFARERSRTFANTRARVPGLQDMVTTEVENTHDLSGDNPLSLGIRWVHPEPGGTFSPLGEGPIRIGRDEENEIRLEAPGVSRVHAEIRKRGDHFVISDLDSTNGTRVGGEAVRSHELALGDVIRIGGWVGVFGEGDGDGQPAFERLSSGLVVGPTSRRQIAKLERVATSDIPVLLIGESGTGKELLARQVHAASGRQGPYCAVNCAALPESLAEAELFGYRKGAFTGADRPHQGHFRAAEGGTLLLDEVVDLPLGVQAKLLRVLEQGEVHPIGEPAPLPIDVRVIAAAQFDLRPLVAEGRFRGDLFARLNGYQLTIPPLRRRSEEIVHLFLRLLADECHGKAPPLSAGAAEALCLHPWPFNVRDLLFVARRAAMIHADEKILHGSHIRGLVDPMPGAEPAAEVGMSSLIAAVRQCGGNITRAAERLGISRPRAYRMLKDVDLGGLRVREG